MPRLLLAFVFVLVVSGQDQSVTPALANLLSFESTSATGVPTGWNRGGTVIGDSQVTHGGRWSGRLEAREGTPGILSIFLPIEFSGSTLTLSGFLRTEAVTGFAGFWMREDGESSPVAFDNMQERKIAGDTEWTEYEINLPLKPDARRLAFGVLCVGTGKAWADDLHLLVDGKPIWEAPKAERAKTPLDRDHEFDGGSGVTLSALTPLQIENLATLGKVWGFLKYHHPRVTGGERHWDYDLFRVMPAVLDAGDRKAALAAITEWAGRLGDPGKCSPCATLLDSDLALRPNTTWIEDESALGTEIRRMLRAALVNRPTTRKQFYVSLTPNVGNPVFEHEPNYAGIKVPDAGFQILALLRFWNVIQYWSPNREIMDEDWNRVLTEFLPRIALAKTPEAYRLQMIALIARVHDTHANLWNGLEVQPPLGACRLPVFIRFLDGQAVVTGKAASVPAALKLKPGDVILELDGVPVPTLVERLTPYYPASNEPTRLRDIGRNIRRGECGTAALRVRRGDEVLQLAVERIWPDPSDPPGTNRALPGETFQLLSKDVAYLKLAPIKATDVPRYIDSAAGTKGLVIDIRNYPSEFVVFTLGNLLARSPTEFARFTTGDLSNPGAFHWTAPLSLTPANPHYSGKVVILVDEISQSQAEYTTMAFRSTPGAVVIGSTTAGADGNVSNVPLPGGLRTMISGIGVFYPDKKPTQRIGILPDVEVKPTIAGIRDGRDEVLEEAIRRIVGPGVSTDEIRKMIPSPF